MAALTVRLALPYPSASDPDNVPGDLQALAEKVDLVAVDRRGGDTITASGAAVKPLVIKGAASQTANLAEFQNSSGTVLAGIDAAGRYVFNVAQTASVATTGGGGALPAAPQDYIVVMLSNGVTRKLPAYNV